MHNQYLDSRHDANKKRKELVQRLTEQKARSEASLDHANDELKRVFGGAVAGPDVQVNHDNLSEAVAANKVAIDIEIERLKTTCFTLNNKVSVTEDLQEECKILSRRLAESENIRNLQKEEISNYERTRL